MTERTDWHENKTGELKLSGKIGKSALPEKTYDPGDQNDLPAPRSRKEIIDALKEKIGAESFRKISDALCSRFKKNSYTIFNKHEFAELVEICESKT